VRPVGAVADEGRHLVKCWACTYRWDGRLHLPRVRWAILSYEAAVEAIEDLIARGGPFTVGDVYRHDRGVTWRAAGLAMHDMHLHGLVRCARRRAAPEGRQAACDRWTAA
jgi:hypothetical protein